MSMGRHGTVARPLHILMHLCFSSSCSRVAPLEQIVNGSPIVLSCLILPGRLSFAKPTMYCTSGNDGTRDKSLFLHTGF